MAIRVCLCYMKQRWYLFLPSGETQYLLVPCFVIVANIDDQCQRFTANSTKTQLGLYKIFRCVFKSFHKQMKKSKQRKLKMLDKKTYFFLFPIKKTKCPVEIEAKKKQQTKFVTNLKNER